MTYGSDLHLILLFQAVVFVAWTSLTIFCLSRSGAGVWAPLGAIGGGLSALTSGLLAVANAQLTLLNHFGLYQLLNEGHRSLALSAVETTGIVFVVLGFVTGLVALKRV